MISKKDELRLREMIQQELKAALYRRITIEKGPRKQGDPEKTVTEEEWNVLDFFCVYLPKIEAALRGMQEDLDHTKNSLAANNNALKVVGEALMAMESSAKRLAQFSDLLQKAQKELHNTDLFPRVGDLEILTPEP